MQVDCQDFLSTSQTGKFANCVPEISKIYHQLYKEHQNCVPEMSVARYKLSRLVHKLDESCLNN